MFLQKRIFERVCLVVRGQMDLAMLMMMQCSSALMKELERVARCSDVGKSRPTR